MGLTKYYRIFNTRNLLWTFAVVGLHDFDRVQPSVYFQLFDEWKLFYAQQSLKID